MKSEFKIQPFCEFVKIDDINRVEISGEIKDNSFYLKWLDKEYKVDTKRILEYNNVKIAEIFEINGKQIGKYILNIQPEYTQLTSENIFEGCCLSITRNNGNIQDAVIEKLTNLDVDEAILIIPPDFSVSIYFNSLGKFNGTGGNISILKGNINEI